MKNANLDTMDFVRATDHIRSIMKALTDVEHDLLHNPSTRPHLVERLRDEGDLLMSVEDDRPLPGISSPKKVGHVLLAISKAFAE